MINAWSIGLISVWLLSTCSLPFSSLYQDTSRKIAYKSENERSRYPIIQTPVDLSMRVLRGLPIVEVRVNGSGPFSFGVDTGAMSPVIFSEALAKELGFTPVGTSTGEAGRPGGRNNGVIPVDSISIGDLMFAEVSAKSINLPYSMIQIDGILGLTLFKDFLMTFDYPEKRFRIERAELPAADGSTVFQLERHPTGLLFLELEVGGEEYSALFDTGNLAGPFYLPKSVATLLEWSGDSRTMDPAITAGGKITIEEVKLAGVIRVEKLTFNQPVVVFGDTFGLPIIGGQPFSGYIVSIDQRNWRLSLTQ